ncbi:hypothetical protein [Rothia aerolata]|uniref:Biotin and thiamin synthesis-associated domain-containing protein n=1 Tax=Rothia aerolata TaxID=1812262 RepID=A0A917MVN4_9MICC|nr:hypothetical protein [Rothia aerolata]GGH66441.1 hypothetical protein GCM10007359_20600 [Rothia aerolata]
MTLNFAELTQKMRAGARPDEEDILAVLEAGPGATFALVEFASEFRRMFFQNTLEVTNLLTPAGKVPPAPVDEGAVVTVGAGESTAELAAAIIQAGQAEDSGLVTVNYKVPDADDEASSADSLTPMYCLRVLAAVRLVSVAKSVRVGQGRDLHLRSLQALAMHVLDSLQLRDYRESEAAGIFDDLKLIRDAGLSVNGAEGRDLEAEYITYLESEGVEDARATAEAILAGTENLGGGGCGGNCSCGSGGCGGR